MEYIENFSEKLFAFYADDPFIQLLNISIVNVEEGQATLGVPVKKEYANAHKIAHGGLIMTLADTSMGASCMTLNKKVVTMDINLNFMKAIPLEGTMTSVASVLHNGGRTMVAEAEIFDDKGNLCAKARGTFFVIEKFVP